MKNPLWLLILIPLLLPLTNTASARTRYASGNTVTQAQLNRLNYLARGQSTRAMRSVLGSPDSFDKYNDYYWLSGGRMIRVEFDESGRWTGKIENASVEVGRQQF